MTTRSKKIPQIAIYNCGGTGLNLGSQFQEIIASSEILSNSVVQYFVDTSRANHREIHTDENTMVIGSGEGSGKKRDENIDSLKQCVPDILHRFQPGHFNIVVGGSAGGSGSVIQGVLLSTLLKEHPALAIVAGSVDSAAEIRNSKQSFKTFQSIAKTRGTPAVIHYRENGRHGTRGQVDKDLISSLTLVCLMLSCTAEKIDHADLRHFLNYPKVTTFPPTLAALEIYPAKYAAPSSATTFAVTTLADYNTPTAVEPTPPYQSAGFLADSQAELLMGAGVVHYAVLGNFFNEIIANINERFDDLEATAALYRDADHTGGDVADDDGILV